MNHIAPAIDALRRTENKLREIVGRAASDGDYAAVVRIASWAQAIRELQSPERQDLQPVKTTSKIDPTVVTRGKLRRTKAAKKRAPSNYPRFFRKGDELVRVAWSRRDRSEYQHKTKQVALKAAVETLANLGKDGRVVSTDEFMPLRDSHGVEIPAYQTYVCIALLKLNGLIEPQGRQGYTIASPESLADAVEVIWRKLPTSK